MRYSRCGKHNKLYPDYLAMCEDCSDELSEQRRRDEIEYQKQHSDYEDTENDSSHTEEYTSYEDTYGKLEKILS
ncbi:MAG: hypothetical protein PHN19_05975 [Patescibacteria group bacterium]|nr:hypothetical protein [Patescibacteria group bacterium]